MIAGILYKSALPLERTGAEPEGVRNHAKYTTTAAATSSATSTSTRMTMIRVQLFFFFAAPGGCVVLAGTPPGMVSDGVGMGAPGSVVLPGTECVGAGATVVGLPGGGGVDKVGFGGAVVVDESVVVLGTVVAIVVVPTGTVIRKKKIW